VDIAPLLSWIEGSGLAARIRESRLLFPLLESVHVIGLALVFGTIAIVDLRLLGVASAQRSFRRMASDILRWTWAAFAVTAVTGSLMFMTNAAVYYGNAYFRAKMVLLVLAGVNVLVFELTAGRTVHRWDRAPSAPPVARSLAALSLLIWVGVIVAGRVIGFTTSRAAQVEPLPSDVDFEELLGFPGDGADAPPRPDLTPTSPRDLR
jgi:uncharacterized membrane protein